MSQYQTLDAYDGTLGGKLPLPAGPRDVTSPGGLSVLQHHWTQGMFGKPERVYDAYAGTGERYLVGDSYGNMYVPDSHASINQFYRGPGSDPTEFHTFGGDPYYWNNMSNNPRNQQSNVMVPNISSTQTREGYQPIVRSSPNEKNFELIEPPKKNSKSPVAPGTGTCRVSNKEKNNSKPKEKRNNSLCFSFGSKTKQLSLILMITVLLIAAITFDLWAESLHRFLKFKVNNGVDITWKKYLLYAITSTLFLYLVTWISGAQQVFEES